MFNEDLAGLLDSDLMAFRYGARRCWIPAGYCLGMLALALIALNLDQMLFDEFIYEGIGFLWVIAAALFVAFVTTACLAVWWALIDSRGAHIAAADRYERGIW